MKPSYSEYKGWSGGGLGGCGGGDVVMKWLWRWCSVEVVVMEREKVVFCERTKHLETDLHFVRDKVISRVIETKKISSADQTSDVLTKGLDKNQHDKLVLKMGRLDVF
ncbi:hypothetical protein Tco_0390164 [Tanacetum coccineum]